MMITAVCPLHLLSLFACSLTSAKQVASYVIEVITP